MVSPTQIRRGEVWWIRFDPSQGSEIRKTRPAVILSINAINRARRTVIVVPLSTKQSANPPIIVPVPSVEPRAMAMCDQVRAVGKGRVVRREGSLADAELRAVQSAVRTVLGLT